jgi:hypothetical protein
MKIATVLMILSLASQKIGAEIELTNLEKSPTEEVLKRQEIFRKEVEKAFDRVKPKDVNVEIVIRKEEDQEHPAMTYKMPSFFKRGKSYAIHIKPSVLKDEVVRLEHIANHEMVHIKNEDPGNARDIDKDELERHTEYEVFKLVGLERYVEYLKYTHSKTLNGKNKISEANFIEIAKRWLGISTNVMSGNIILNSN